MNSADRSLIEVWSAEHSITSWSTFESAMQRLDASEKSPFQNRGWLFRGERSFSSDLKTSIETRADQYGVSLQDLYSKKIEQGLIRRFKREYPLHATILPENNDHILWLSIMQHHGAPTRLLDITYSIYVALYFALWDYHAEEEAALWCLNANWLIYGWNQNLPEGYKQEFDRDRNGRYLQLFNIVLGHRRRKVYIINPYYFPERLVLQQAGFLMPLDIRFPFMTNLLSMPISPKDSHGKAFSGKRIVKIRIHLSQNKLDEVRYRLLRMNINNATLFPGIDGFARSLRDRFPFEEQRSGLKPGF